MTDERRRAGVAGFNERVEAERLARAVEFHDRARAATDRATALYWLARSARLQRRRSPFLRKLRVGALPFSVGTRIGVER